MISIKTQTNLGNAKTYFRDHLNSGDYYRSKGKTPGEWHGKGAELLGLRGEVTEDDFLHLCSGEKPDGTKLTMRQNTVREGDKANKRIFFDFTIAPPKSVSIAGLVGGDERIMEAHARAVAACSKELEKFAGARVRKGGRNGDRKTGNLVMAAFTHDTSRAVAVGATPDPLLHTHLLCFNATKDGEEGWKALQSYEMLKAQQYVASVYDHELCRELKRMGYAIRENGKSWELDHISNETCEKFSKRRRAILEKTAELERAGAKSGHEKLKDMAAHDERIRKQGSQEADVLRDEWKQQMNAAELEALRIPKAGKASKKETPKDAVVWTKKHLFERNAVVTEEMFLATCLKHSRGGDYSVEDLREAFMADKGILHEVDSNRITTQESLATEKFILNCVKDGKGRYQPFAPSLLESASSLNDLQREAAEKLLSSRDFCSLFRGGAGTGKTYTLQHLQNALLANGKAVIVLAPQNQQVAGLINDGFDAQTVSAFLANEIEMDRNTVVVIDEAGQIGGQDMRNLMEKILHAGARTILSGDTRQHGSVAATDALRAIEKYASPHTAELAGELAIQRQQVDKYKSAVAAAEAGDTSISWDLLEENGSILDTTLESRTADAARLFVAKMGESGKYDKGTGTGGSVLMLSQTNVEVDSLNTAIREELARAGKLDMAKSFNREVLKQVDLSNAQKERKQYYPPGAVILLNRKVGVFKAGSVASFVREDKNRGIVINVDGREQKVSEKQLENLTVCTREQLNLATGDKIQLKANLRISAKEKLANGQIVEVVQQLEDGGLVVKSAYGRQYTLPADFKMLKHGYAVSSYGSQGKTVDHVIISDSQCKAATSTKEFYVSISRGKWSCSILTADRESLQEHIQNLGQRELASDLKLVRDKVPVKPVKRPLVPSVERLGLREVNVNTSNTDKLREFDKLGLNIVGMTSVDLKEPASDAWRVVAYKAAQVPENTLVEDTSLEIEGADVGVNVKWQLENMDQYIGKRATVRVILGMVENGKVCHYLGEVHGQIVPPRGNAGFGFDKYFLPDGAKQTLAQFKPHEFNARALAVENFNAGKIERETDPIPVWHGEWQGDLEKDIERPDQLSAFLGDPGAKAAHSCIDVSTGKKVELFGSLDANNWAVRGFAELQNICVKGIGMVRGILREKEKAAEVERVPVQVREPVRSAEIEHER